MCACARQLNAWWCEFEWRLENIVCFSISFSFIFLDFLFDVVICALLLTLFNFLALMLIKYTYILYIYRSRYINRSVYLSVDNLQWLQNYCVNGSYWYFNVLSFNCYSIRMRKIKIADQNENLFNSNVKIACWEVFSYK